MSVNKRYLRDLLAVELYTIGDIDNGCVNKWFEETIDDIAEKINKGDLSVPDYAAYNYFMERKKIFMTTANADINPISQIRFVDVFLSALQGSATTCATRHDMTPELLVRTAIKIASEAVEQLKQIY